MKTKITSFILIATALLAGMSLAVADDRDEAADPETQAVATAQLTLGDLRTFTDIFNQARKNYVEAVDDKTLLDAAIRGMLQELDPHSSYLPAEDYEELNDVNQGRYSGIGIDVKALDGRIVVNAVINKSPADRSGMNPGDVITSIDGKEVKGRPLPEAMDELLGEPDSEVVLKVLSPEGEERELFITREYIQVPTLSFRLIGESFAYFKVSQFHWESAADLERALVSIQNDGIELSALIMDLRGNPGGIMQQAVNMADGFLDEGVIVSTRGRNAKMQMEFSAQPGQWLSNIPVMILVDRGTASASEVLAGALQDHSRALIVGERTFGKGSVQSLLPLRNGGGIKLTTARYYTPSGRSIQAHGIEPDVNIDWDVSTETSDGRKREADLERHLGNETGTGDIKSPGMTSVLEDFPLEQILEALRDAGIIKQPSGAQGDPPTPVGHVE